MNDFSYFLLKYVGISTLRQQLSDMVTYGTYGMLSTALRKGREVSPKTAEIKPPFFSFLSGGTLSTDARKNEGVPEGG